MNRAPAFQFYAKDWLDFRVQRMTFASQGAYIKLLAFMWADSADQCSVINNDELISRALGTSVDTWQRFKTEIQFKSDPILIEKDGFLISERLKEEARKQRKYRKLQSEKGRKSSLQRLNHGSTVDQPEHQPEANSSSSSSSSSSLQKQKTNTLSSFEKTELDDALQKVREESRVLKQEAIEILNFLNLKANKRFPPNETNLGFIRARLKEGADRQTCFSVIAMKCREWLTDPDARKWLRPATLFNRTKFNTYIGELGPIEQEEQSDAMPGMPEAVTAE